MFQNFLMGTLIAQVIPFGLCVWSTGVGPTEFTTSLPFAKTPKGDLPQSA
jgi:hypothetical protein